MARDEEERRRVDLFNDFLWRVVVRGFLGGIPFRLDDRTLVGNILSQAFEKDLEHGMDLHGQLPRRHDDHGKHFIPPQPLLRGLALRSTFPRELLFPSDEPLEDGDDVGERLARPGDGFHEEILVFGDRERDEGGLDGGEGGKVERGVDRFEAGRR